MLVSLAHMGDGLELERAFSGSSLYYIFNFMTLVVLLPLEVTTQYLYRLTAAMLPETVGEGESWEGPIKAIVSPLTKSLIIANKGLIEDISTGVVASCDAVYPVECTDGITSYETCKGHFGVIACNKDTGGCPAFFQDGASFQDDSVSGWVCLIVSLVILLLCMIGLVALLRKMLLGTSTRIIYKATNINPYLAIVVGTGVTVLVQSSSITTSALVPLAGVGVLKLENMYPLVLGADIGTTFTALMAALVSSKVQSLQIALAHLFFNVTGIILWYPIPFMRNLIFRFSRMLGRATRHWRSFPILFIVLMFFLLPLLLFGISACFEKKTTGFTALGTFLIIVIVSGCLYFWLWWSCRGGRGRCLDCIERRQRKAAAIQALADDMDYLKVDTEWCKNEIGRLKDFAAMVPIRMEEGKPVYVRPPRGPPPPMPPPSSRPPSVISMMEEEDERLSVYESCRSKPWAEVFAEAAGSVRSAI